MASRIGTWGAVLAAVCLLSLPAQAGVIHQSPGMRKNERRMCPDGRPMHNTRMGRTVLYGCN